VGKIFNTEIHDINKMGGSCSTNNKNLIDKDFVEDKSVDKEKIEIENNAKFELERISSEISCHYTSYLQHRNHEFYCEYGDCIFKKKGKRHVHLHDKIQLLKDTEIYCKKCSKIINLLIATVGYTYFTEYYDVSLNSCKEGGYNAILNYHCNKCCKQFLIQRFYFRKRSNHEGFEKEYPFEIHNSQCCCSYKENETHCNQCHEIYNEKYKTHCETCHITYDKNNKYHCNICHKTKNNHEFGFCHVKCDPCGSIYDPFELMHCSKCHASYNAAQKKCPNCEDEDQTNQNDLELNNSKNKCNENACSICLGPKNADQNITTLKCGHSFHFNCIGRWTLSNKTCPLCRKKIS
jgi:Ring finger domain